MSREDGIPGVDAVRLQQRIAQEIEAARQRPGPPSVAPAPVMSGVAAAAAPPSALGPSQATPPSSWQRIKSLLRTVPLLGGALAWANAFRTLAVTRRQLAEARQLLQTHAVLLEQALARRQPVPPSDRLDAFYIEFEENFRGSRQEIKQRLVVYLGRLQAAGIGASAKPVLDLGCGRGEWLELLGEAGISAYGVDLNTINVDHGRKAGFDVRGEDVLGHLRGVADASLAAVTAFQLIEHLPFEALMEVVKQAHRVIVPGGLFIVETPNPENVVVGSQTFYNDPTHRHPIPPGVARFLLQYGGFVDNDILRLHPHADSERLKDGSEVAVRLNELFYGPRDYAVIGRKP